MGDNMYQYLLYAFDAQIGQHADYLKVHKSIPLHKFEIERKKMNLSAER